jgi:hypothetical protein
MTYDVNKIVERIASTTYKYKSCGTKGEYWDVPVIEKEAIPILRNILNEELTEMCMEKAELEAKCFAYEAIISNSNFKPVITSGLLNSKGEQI